MTVTFWDRNGHNITREKWMKLLEENPEYRRIALDVRSDGVEVSTVWLGLDHRLIRMPGEKPLIFETMTFPGWECWRYSTEVQAREGHWRVMGMGESEEAVE